MSQDRPPERRRAGRTDDARIAVCAAGEAAWHAAAFAGLGVEWRDDGRIAWAPVVPHRFLLGAVTLEPSPLLPDGLLGPWCDSWSAMSPGDGWTARVADPWMFRAPASLDLALPPGVTVEPTDNPLMYERIAFLGAGGNLPATPGELHPPGSERVPGLTLLVARLDGEPVGGALSVVHEVGVTVSGVAVLPAARRRGIGAALTAAALGLAPHLPATLNASELGYGMYARLGFVDLGRPTHWLRSHQ